MKTRMVSLFVGSLLLLSTTHLFADGVVNFNNVGVAPEGRIYYGSWIYQNGTFEFTSYQACGPDFRAGLYWGPAGTTEESALVQAGAAANFLPTPSTAGMFHGGNRLIPSSVDGPVLSLQVRVWNGPYGSYEEAVANILAGSQGLAGKGPIFEFKSSEPHNPLDIPLAIGRDPDWRGFVFGADAVTLVLVPEPSTWAILGLGLGLVLRPRFFRRRPL